MSHTPGPWIRNDTTIYWSASDSKRWIVAQAVEVPIRPVEEVVANACLMSASPELLMWLEFAVRRLGDIDDGISDHASEEIAKVIAKAKGRTP